MPKPTLTRSRRDKKSPARSPRAAKSNRPAPRPMRQDTPQARGLIFRREFTAIWEKLFTSPIHLDSAVSKAPDSVKGALMEILRAILRRPHSLARFVRFYLSEGEPFGLSKEELAEWKTAEQMAARLFDTWRDDPKFQEGQGGTQFDYPDELVHEWVRDFGKETAKALTRTLGEEAPLSLRVSRKFSVQEVLSNLNDSGELEVRARFSKISPQGLVIPGYSRVMQNELFKKGAYEIQDTGSQVMSYFAIWPEAFRYALADKPGVFRSLPPKAELPPYPSKSLTVVDACAGAGGKSLALADALGGKGQVFAYDVSDKKLLSLRKRATRAGLNSIKTVLVKENEEALVVDRFKQKADIVLVDAPCSGLGVLRRNPDIKWRLDQETLERLPELQLRLLNTYGDLVKPEGRLVYGVCTFRKDETSRIVERFLEEAPFTSEGGGFLGPHESDGFFFWSFKRRK